MSQGSAIISLNVDLIKIIHKFVVMAAFDPDIQRVLGSDFF